MSQKTMGLFAGILLVAGCTAFAGNPIITHLFTADPSAHVYEDRVYIYPSHDKDDNDWFDMEDYHVFSSKDMVNWVDHGVALHVDDVPWAMEYMWAPDCVYKDGTYYFYFPARDSTGTFHIGVATGSRPEGPFVPESTWIEGSFSIDPCVFIDDDGAAYMYFGGVGGGHSDGCYVAKLTDDMLAFESEPQKLSGLKDFFEAAWVHKYDGRYYLSYSTKHHIHYAVADAPLGPFEYEGEVIGDVSGWTNHHSFVEYQDQWYAFYHNSDISGKTEQRSVCVDYLYYNEDGTMKTVVQTDNSVDPVPYTPVPRTAFDTIQAEDYTAHGGIHTRSYGSGGRSLGRIEGGDFLRYEALDFGEGAGSIAFAAAAKQAGVTAVLRLDSLDGPRVAELDLASSSDAGNWTTLTAELAATVADVHDLFFVFEGPEEVSAELDWFTFMPGGTPASAAPGSVLRPQGGRAHQGSWKFPRLFDTRGRRIAPSGPRPRQVIIREQAGGKLLPQAGGSGPRDEGSR